MDYFTLLDLPRSYDIDVNLLQKHYLQRQAAFHPDRAINSTEKVDFAARSAELNIAYSTLKDNYKRASYILLLLGIDTNANDLRNNLSSEILEKILEEYSKIDSLTSAEELAQVLKENNAQKDNLLKNLSTAFSQSNTQQALAIVIELKYLTNLINNIKSKIDNADSHNQ